MAPRRKQDRFGRRAKREGFPARSVYKLEEIDRRVGLFRLGQRVLDLGASPGSWALYAASRVGPRGRVLAVDLKACEVTLPPQVEFREADVAALDPLELGGPFDVVLSDMAPKTSGQRHADQYRSFELFLQALRLADDVLSAEGLFVGKIFQGPEYETARAQLREMCDNVRTIRPKATRGESYEVFLVGRRSAEPTS